jgi:putative protease
MKFDLLDADGEVLDAQRYFLSLKDMNQSEHLGELIEAGAVSFKIEGRLKDVTYVKNVTAAYSQMLNDYIKHHPSQYERASQGRCTYTFTPDLRKTFNRGYTHYFLHGRQPDIASFDTPKAMGEYVGVVKELRHDSFNVAGVASFANGDGLCFINQQGVLEGFRANRVVGNRIYPYRMPQGLCPGVRLYRNSDQEFERLLSRQSAVRRIPITISLRVVPEGFILSTQGVSVSISCEHQEARKSPIENIMIQLSKLGDTIYSCEDVDIPDDFNYFIPNSVLSDMRRALIAELQNNRTGGQAPCEVTKRSQIAEYPLYSQDYLHNISNQLSQRFYGANEKSAFELKSSSEIKELDGPIMQCRHCIRYSLGYCVKNGGKRPEWREPLSLVLGDGRRFQLEFDCKHCQMNVYVSE